MGIENDAKWKSLNKKLEEAMVKNDWYGMGNIYYQLAYIVEGEGKDPSEYRNFGYQTKLKSHKEEIKRYLKLGVVSSVKVLTAGSDSCEECAKNEGLEFSFEDVAEGRAIPVASCRQSRRVGCRCVLVAVTD